MDKVTSNPATRQGRTAMRSRRDVLKTALGGSALLLAAACGGGGGGGQTAAPPTAAPASAAKPATGASAQPTTAAAAAPTSAGAPKTTAPANLQGATVSVLQWNHFIPTADPFYRQQIEDWGKQNGVNASHETINGNDLVPRFTAAIQGQSGPTVFQMQYLAPHAFAEGLLDVTDLAKEIEPKFGTYYSQVNTSATVDGKYRSIPYNIAGNAFVYRKSYFDKAGVKKPETWDDFHDAVKKLAAIGKPIGQTFAQTFGDAPTFFYPLLWSYGGKEVEQDGKTVAINSKESIEAVKFAKACWDDGLEHKALGWDDSGNNTAFLADEISATLNGASIFFVAAGLDGKTPPKPWGVDDMDHFLTPKGPAGQFAWFLDFTQGIPSYVKGKDLDATKELLRYLYDPKQFDAWFELQKGYSMGPGNRLEQSPMWDTLPKAMAPYRTAGKIARALGYAGQPTPKTNEVFAKYIIVNMFSRAVQGTSPEDSVKQAEAEMKEIYGS